MAHTKRECAGVDRLLPLVYATCQSVRRIGGHQRIGRHWRELLTRSPERTWGSGPVENPTRRDYEDWMKRTAPSPDRDDDSESEDDVRLDKWLWAARFYKTRSLAAEAIDGGKVEVGGERAKRSRQVRVGDVVRIRKPPFEQIVVVRALASMRGSGAIAATLYEETSESRSARETLATQMRALGPPAFRGGGKPSKKERRDIGKWKGRG